MQNRLPPYKLELMKITHIIPWHILHEILWNFPFAEPSFMTRQLDLLWGLVACRSDLNIDPQNKVKLRSKYFEYKFKIIKVKFYTD